MGLILKQNFCLDVNGRFVTTFTLYLNDVCALWEGGTQNEYEVREVA